MSTNKTEFELAHQLFAPTPATETPLDRLQGYEMGFAKSSFIARFGYNADLNRLAIHFGDGRISIYPFPQDAFLDMLVADSVGKFYHARIRGAKIEPIDSWKDEEALVDGTLPGAPEEIAGLESSSDAIVPEVVEPEAAAPTESGPPWVTEPVAELVATEVVVEEIETAKETELKVKSQSLSERADGVVICDQQTYDNAAEIFAALIGMEAEIKDEYDPMIAKAYASHKEICQRKKRRLDPVLSAKERVSIVMGTWAAEQKRLQGEAERQARLAAEQVSQEETLKIAVEAQEAGAAPEEVEMILSSAPAAHVVPVSSTFTPAFGGRTKWKAYLKPGVTELQALKLVVEAALKNPEAYLPCLMLDMREINGRADRQKAALTVPGFVARPQTKATAKALKGGK